MLALDDLIHLPLLDNLVAQLAATERGVIVVAGQEPPAAESDARSARARSAGPRVVRADITPPVPPSGRPVVFGILVRQVLDAHPDASGLVVASSHHVIRVPPRLRRRIEFLTEQDEHTPVSPAQLIQAAVERHPDVLIVEQLNDETAAPVLAAAREGLLVLVQFDSPLRRQLAVRQISELAAHSLQGSDRTPDELAWLVAVRRLPMLCPDCRTPSSTAGDAAHRLLQLVEPNLVESQLVDLLPEKPTWYESGRGAECDHSGRQGELMVFDVAPLRTPAPSPGLCMEAYVIGMAARGYFAVNDALDLEAAQHYRTHQLLTAAQGALAQVQPELAARSTELQVQQRVLARQTRASISLQEVGHALITFTELDDLTRYICRRAGDLCGADRAILYLWHPDGMAEIGAVTGWDESLVRRRVPGELVFGAGLPRVDGSMPDVEPEPFAGYPPGVPERAADVEGVYLRAGLRVPLVAQHEVVGLLIFHSTVKRRFVAREVALLQALANQGAVAIQRAGLFAELRDKLERLQAAQTQLAQKERLERELELARQVQESMLPRIFPLVPGVSFFARSEPARQVGGDFYDVFLLDAERLGLVMADVSDKGMHAALYMALARSLLRAEARREASPAAVLRAVHRLLLEVSGRSHFVTVFYGVLETRTRQLTYVRAGHEPALLLHANHVHRLTPPGTIIGLLDPGQLELVEEHIRLGHGDRLVLYTDGLLDALDGDGQPFGRVRLEQLLGQEASSPLAAFGENVFRALRAHQGQAEQFDDMSLLAVQLD